jgi:thiamine biosynthesis protein ThiS
MRIMINGESQILEKSLTVKDLLETLKVDHRAVAVELNLSILARESYDAFPLKDGDTLEIIRFVGGG